MVSISYQGGTRVSAHYAYDRENGDFQMSGIELYGSEPQEPLGVGTLIFKRAQAVGPHLDILEVTLDQGKERARVYAHTDKPNEKACDTRSQEMAFNQFEVFASQQNLPLPEGWNRPVSLNEASGLVPQRRLQTSLSDALPTRSTTQAAQEAVPIV